MMPMHPLLRTAIWVSAAPLGLYTLFLGLGSIPFFQRQSVGRPQLGGGHGQRPTDVLSDLVRSFLYAHKIHTLWWADANQPEQFGFASWSNARVFRRCAFQTLTAPLLQRTR